MSGFGLSLGEGENLKTFFVLPQSHTKSNGFVIISLLTMKIHHDVGTLISHSGFDECFTNLLYETINLVC